MKSTQPKIGTLFTLATSPNDQWLTIPTADPAMRGMVSYMRLSEDGIVGPIITSRLALSDCSFVDVVPDPGKIVIMADMEGISGVPASWSAVTPSEETGGQRTPTYAESCRQMTLDVQFAVAGARAAGARNIVVSDSHWHDTNLSDADFDVPVVRGSMTAMREIQTAKAVILIGWHARFGALSACLPHTYTERVKRLSIDGREVGEAGMLARLAAGFGVPVVMVSGDQAACDEVGADWDCQLVTSKVMRDGILTLRDPTQVRVEILQGAITAIRNLTAAVYPVFQQGRFDVEIRSGYEVPGDEESTLVGERCYRIEKPAILETYGTFQRFIERLPALKAD